MIRINRTHVLGVCPDLQPPAGADSQESASESARHGVAEGWIGDLFREWKRDLASVWNGTFRVPGLAECEADLPECPDCGLSIVRCRCGGM